jgi:membrane protein implicated in regulation of membrane protease activity
MNLPEFLSPQVIWFIIGVVLLVLELALPGLIVMFFGVGAWITALAIILFHPGINIQILIFVISSILSLIILRRYLKKKFFSENRDNTNSLEEEFIGKIAIAEVDFKSGVRGKVAFKGTSWTAICDVDVLAGDQLVIKDKESIILMVTKK